jgi:hypothetical protein
MSVEVNIYMNNIIKFFKSNPDELKSLVEIEKEQLFYEEIRKVATENEKNGNEVSLTKKQLIDVCVKLNKGKNKYVEYEAFQNTKFGTICLN